MTERLTAAQYRAMMGLVSNPANGSPGVKSSPLVEKKEQPKIRMPKIPNQGEFAYSQLLAREFPHLHIVYEGVSLKLPSGCNYRADWALWAGNAMVMLVEVKGKVRLGSAGKSSHAFKEAVAAYPAIIFRHATRSDGEWNITEANNSKT